MPTRLLLAGLAAVLFAAPALAQTHAERFCGTPTPTTDEVLSSVSFVERWIAANPALANRDAGTFVTIPVAFHIITAGDTPAQGNVPDQWVIDQMEVLNAGFNQLGLRFVLAFQQRVNNPAWRGITNTSPAQLAMKQALNLNTARWLNIYSSSLGNSLLGWATFPTAGVEGDPNQGLVILDQSMPGGSSAPYNLGDTGTHELGHYVGLFHTFQGGCSGSGDGVSDTPAEASEAFGCPTGRDSCPALPGLDPITNYMDYTDDSCMFEFTPGQLQRAAALMNAFRPTIMGQTGAFLATPSVAFPQTYVGQTVTRTVRVANLANGPLTITGATSTSGAFSVVVPTEPIGEASYVDLEVTFAPTASGAVSGTITITTDDPTTPSVTVSVSGTAEEAASAGFSATAFWAEAALGGTETRTLTLSNAGPAALAYTLAGGARAAAPSVPASDARGGGGPDAFGYRWHDSRQAGGPVYDWVDIATTGTPVTFTGGLQSVPLPFAFPFYGTDRTAVQITTEGFLSFSGTSASPFNNQLPSPSIPNDLLAVFWDNLNPAGGGEVRYQDMGDGRFVVSYLGVAPGTGSGALTFQAILHDDGRVVYQYQTMTGTLNSATVGLENATGTDGLTIAYNTDYVADNLAVEIFTLPTWLTVSPTSGTIAAGTTGDVTLTLDAADLRAGSYQSLLELTTNDPTLPQPTRIHVVLSVDGVLAPPALVAPLFGATAVATTSTLSWTAAEDATGYAWEVATDPTFATTVAAGTSATTQASPALLGGTTYYWRVRSESTGLPSAWSLPFSFVTAGTVADEPAAERGALALGAAFPNPTTGRVTLPLTLADADAVTVRVLDVTGRTVAVLADARAMAAGEHRLEWDASRLPAGLYVVQVRSTTGTATTRVTVLR